MLYIFVERIWIHYIKV